MRTTFRLIVLFIIFDLICPFVITDTKAIVYESEPAEDTLDEPFCVTDLTVYPVSSNGYDEQQPLASNPTEISFTLGKEYALVLSYESSPEGDNYFTNIINNSGILTTNRGAGALNWSLLFVKASQTGTCSLKFDDNYTLTVTVTQLNGTWKHSSKGWWYDRGDGTYPADEFEEINGNTYYFNGSGYMVTGWYAVSGNWYFFSSSGAMKKNAWEGDYYLLNDGTMAKNQWVDNSRYYVGADGKWLRNYGVPRWESNSKGWWYNDGYGNYPVSQFMTINGNTYYFNSSGYMVTGWQAVNGAWYFFSSSGAMKKNAWEGDYYLLSDGQMARNQWVDNSRYYVGADGKWLRYYGIPHWESNSKGWWYDDGYGNYPVSQFRNINGNTYYFNSSGYMVTGWQAINGAWYFFSSSGAMKKNAWEGDYYLRNDGTMATNSWIGHYYVDGSGKCISYPYVASKNSAVFHKWNCGEVKNVKAKNLIQYATYEEAAKDHRPCRICNP